MLGNCLVGISGISWTLVYIALIYKGFKDKDCGMPLFALTLNFAWELIYGIDGLFISKSFIPVQAVANIVWAGFDFFILITWFLYGKKHMPYRTQKYFIPWTLLAIICGFTMQFAFYFSCQTIEIASIYSAFAQNVAMSIMFIQMFFERKNTNAQSLSIAIFKCIGTLTPTIYGQLNGINIYILLTGILCFVFDIIYIYLIFQKQDNYKPIVKR